MGRTVFIAGVGSGLGMAEMPLEVMRRVLDAVPRLCALKSGEFHDIRALH